MVDGIAGSVPGPETATSVKTTPVCQFELQILEGPRSQTILTPKSHKHLHQPSSVQPRPMQPEDTERHGISRGSEVSGILGSWACGLRVEMMGFGFWRPAARLIGVRLLI